MSLSLFTGCTDKPVLELQQTREALAKALDFEADIYAPEEIELAQFNLESGEFAIAEQAQVSVWGRSYTVSLEFLALAFEQAGQAQAIAEANKVKVFEQAKKGLPTSQVAFQAALEAVETASSTPITRQQIQSFEDELAGIFATLNQAENIYACRQLLGSFHPASESPGNIGGTRIKCAESCRTGRAVVRGECGELKISSQENRVFSGSGSSFLTSCFTSETLL